MTIEAFLRQTTGRFTSAVGTAVTVQDRSFAHQIGRRWDDKLRRLLPPGASATIRSGGDDQAETDPGQRIVWIERVWIRPPNLSCVESMSPGGEMYRTIVGTTGWQIQYPGGRVIGADWPPDEHVRAIEQAIDPGHPIVALALLQPWRLTRSYKLVDKGEAIYRNHPVIRLQGMPAYSVQSVVESGQEDAPLIFEGADEAEFLIDVERAVVLRWAGFAGGLKYEYESTRFTTIEFDVETEDWRFDLSRSPV